MLFIVWSGFGPLVPLIAIVGYMLSGLLFGRFMPEAGMMVLGSLISSAALVAAGLFFRKKNMRRHLYWIPMEYWAIATMLMGLSEFAKLFCH